MTQVTGLEIFFNPSARHVQEERERAQLTVDDEEAGDPPFGVDLDKGTVTLPRRPPREPAPGTAAPDETDDAEPDPAGDDPS